jgi:hypothetical protein
MKTKNHTDMMSVSGEERGKILKSIYHENDETVF